MGQRMEHHLMRALLVVALVGVSACAALIRYDVRTTPVSRSIVRVTEETKGSPDGVCTGMVLAQNRVLTAAHCVGEAMQADGQPAIILKVDEFYDLVWLDVLTIRPILVLSDDPVHESDEVQAYGYAWGWDRLTMLTCRVVHVDFSPNPKMPVGVFTQGGYIPGMSGGPVVNSRSEMVGIIQQTNDGIGYGVGVQLIRAFLLGTK